MTALTSRVTVLGVSLKQYMGIAESAAWAQAIAAIALNDSAITRGIVRAFVLPSLPSIPAVTEALSGTQIKIGAQDLFWEDRGPYTGGVSGIDLRDLGCQYVEIGHSERRNVFGETDREIRLKLLAAVRNSLTPVLCVGEQTNGPTRDASIECIQQLDSALDILSDRALSTDLIVAYEPEWAIGNGTPAPADRIAEVTAAIRTHLTSLPGVRCTTVLYGGSAKAGTLTELEGSVDGLFLGRFVHAPADFGLILHEASTLHYG